MCVEGLDDAQDCTATDGGEFELPLEMDKNVQDTARLAECCLRYRINSRELFRAS